ncbi:unnamed protein product [Linum tenue]|uniref:Uncharacterized protein n=1 Tax=Linum tenue TaxID=586396 RepID=A0AAV0GP21_9ROSI|nr:unnamed protein product [Linum tenue]
MKLHCSLPPMHNNFDLPAPFVLHTDCPHYWRFHLEGSSLPASFTFEFHN